MFLLSDRGRGLAAGHPNARGLLKQWGIPLPALPAQTQTPPSPSLPSSQQPLGNGDCQHPAGALFNLEPETGSPGLGYRVPQNEESVDFIPQGGMDGSDLVIEGANDYRGFFGPLIPSLAGTWGLSGTGYYVHRRGADCRASFEGGLPHLVNASSGETIYGFGDPVISADGTRGLVYAADLRFGQTTTALGLFATSVATLNSLSACPNGTHVLDASGNDTVASACWPTKMLFTVQPPSSVMIDKPHLRADERKQGAGAGDVYITWTRFDLVAGTSQIQIAACPSNFAGSCSTPFGISGLDSETQFSHIALRPDGVITITYVNINFIPMGHSLFVRQTFDIKYVSCTPNGAPAAPTCSAPTLITTENTPLTFGGRLESNTFRVNTYPTHDNRLNNGTYEEFVAWSRCKASSYQRLGSYVIQQVCPDAQLVMTWSSTDGAGNATGWAPVSAINNDVGDQIMPWVRTDRSREIVNVSYLSSEQDPFYHRFNAVLSQIPAAKHKAEAPRFLTSIPAEPADDPFLGSGFIGDYIGVAAKGSGASSRAYIGFTGQFYKGTMYGVPVSGQDNLIYRIDY